MRILAVTTFNRKHYLKQCIESWISTRNNNVEWLLIVADDGSNDGTIEYIESLNIKKVVLKHNRNGIHFQNNKIINFLSKIDFEICYRSDDDIVFLKNSWDDKYFEASKTYQHLVFHDIEWMKKIWNANDCLHYIEKNNLISSTDALHVQGAFYTITKDIVEKVGYFDMKTFGKCGYGHVDFTARCCRLGFNEFDNVFDIKNSNELMTIIKDNYNEADNTRWIENTNEARKRKQTKILENRTYIPYNEWGMKIVTSDIGMTHHAKLFAKTNGLEYYTIDESKNFENIYQLGVYTIKDYENIANRTTGEILLHWCGSDSNWLLSQNFKPHFPPFVKHIAQSNYVINNLKKIGIEASLSRRFNDERALYPIVPLPQTFTVLIFLPFNYITYPQKAVTHNLFAIEEIVKECKDIKFLLLGSIEKEDKFNFNNIDNYKFISLLDEPEKYRSVLRNCSCLIRFTKKKEGFSQMIMQMLLSGRRVISDIEQEYVEQFDIDYKDKIVNRLREMAKIKEPFYEAANFYHTRKDINNFL